MERSLCTCGPIPWRTCKEDSFFAELQTYSLRLWWQLTSFAGVIWVLFTSSCSLKATIKRLSVETHVLKWGVLLSNLSAPVVCILEEYVWVLIFIRDAGPQFAALLVTDTFDKCSLENLTSIHSNDFTGSCVRPWNLYAMIM